MQKGGAGIGKAFNSNAGMNASVNTMRSQAEDKALVVSDGLIMPAFVHAGKGVWVRGVGGWVTRVTSYKGYKVGLQPETLADGDWMVKQNQPVSKIETKSDTKGVWVGGWVHTI